VSKDAFADVHKKARRSEDKKSFVMIEFLLMPGDVSLLPSGHDAWVVGHEPAVVVDFQGMIDYAKSKRDTDKS
jgi:hypothetical protein